MSIKSGARLAELRKLNGYSQESLAEKLGLSRQAISKWERGESSPDTDTLIELAGLYDVSLDELIGHKSENSVKGAPTESSRIGQDEPKTESKKKLIRLKAKQKGKPLYPGLSAKLAKFPFPLLIVVVYIVLGFAAKLWHPMWILFLLIPAYYHFAIAVKATTKKGLLLGLPIVETSLILFLILGFAVHAWKWAWLLFILDVFYYWYIGSFIKAKGESEDHV